MVNFGIWGNQWGGSGGTSGARHSAAFKKLRRKPLKLRLVREIFKNNKFIHICTIQSTQYINDTIQPQFDDSIHSDDSTQFGDSIQVRQRYAELVTAATMA